MLLCRTSCSGTALLLLLYMLATPASADNLDVTKQELRDLESKVEARVGQLSRDALPLSAPDFARSTSAFLGSRHNQRSSYGSSPQLVRSKIPIELDLLVENDAGERSKRFDDYGHMRFGKRGGDDHFDDYGHMRFGRK